MEKAGVNPFNGIESYGDPASGAGWVAGNPFNGIESGIC
jgi:hypothetical protein